MMAAPYNPSTLELIRAGASSRELGWDASFYASVCRKHGIEGVPYPTVKATLPLPADDPNALHWSMAAGVIRRGEAFVSLSAQQAVLFNTLFRRRKDEHFVPGEVLCNQIGERSRVSQIVRVMNPKIEPLGIRIKTKLAKHGGYRLIDMREGGA
jgi:hypothetical protein